MSRGLLPMEVTATLTRSIIVLVTPPPTTTPHHPTSDMRVVGGKKKKKLGWWNQSSGVFQFTYSVCCRLLLVSSNELKQSQANQPNSLWALETSRSAEREFLVTSSQGRGQCWVKGSRVTFGSGSHTLVSNKVCSISARTWTVWVSLPAREVYKENNNGTINNW